MEVVHSSADAEPRPAPNPKIFYSIEETCEVLGVKRAFLYELVMRQQVPSVALGRRRLIPVAELERWAAELAAREGDAHSPPAFPRRVA